MNCLCDVRFWDNLGTTRAFSSISWCMLPLSSFTRKFSSPVCDALSVSGPAILITIVEGRCELNKLLSCLRYASVPVSNKDSRVTKPLDFVCLTCCHDLGRRWHCYSHWVLFCLFDNLLPDHCECFWKHFKLSHLPCLQTCEQWLDHSLNKIRRIEKTDYPT